MSLRSFINRALGRSRPSSDDSSRPDPRRATDDWKAGDLGECIGKEPWFFMGRGPTPGPRPGDLVLVTAVGTACGFDALMIEGWPHWWQASAFRKLRPNQREGSRTAWRDLLKTVPSRREKVDA